MGKGLAGRFVKNLSFAFTAQLLSLLASLLASLAFPKLLGVEQFAYWQLFLFYANYIALFHLGLTDGVYLRYGGVPLEEIDPEPVGAQLRLMSAVHCVLGLLIAALALCIPMEPGRRIVWICLAVCLPLSNFLWFLGGVFQAGNETKVYSISVILIKIAFLAAACGLLLARCESFVPFVVLYLITQAVGDLYIAKKGRRFLASRRVPLRRTLPAAWENMKIGLPLTISSITSTLILGIGRVLVDLTEGLEAFGYISLALSMTNFFLQFITQVSMVMFPMLRQFGPERAKQLYGRLRSLLSYALCGVLVLYVPARYVLQWWLPQYAQSFSYLAVLLPVCIFDGKMQLLYNTYLKVLRKQRALLAINLGAFLLSCAACSVAVFILRSTLALAVIMVTVVGVRSAVAGAYLARLMEMPVERNLAWEALLTAGFILANQFLSGGWAFAACLAGVAVYWAVNWKDIYSGKRRQSLN